ncbi:hypothetical protein DFH07DRAFT_781908 [Mycena maculata]|uniref:Uncharacterized protein n=1 Tax=Mycena maculata TaxID=230809 RepID=A0AAD7HVW0_9AGAR|nr:hypothetical protein DFH07DRAFT_781908 [Mycena maculata]
MYDFNFPDCNHRNETSASALGYVPSQSRWALARSRGIVATSPTTPMCLHEELVLRHPAQPFPEDPLLEELPPTPRPGLVLCAKLLCAKPKEERETSGISGRGHKSGASGRRPEVLLSAVLATPQLGRVPEGVRSDPEEAGGSGQTPLEPNANVTDFVEVGAEEASDEVEGIRPGIWMTGGKNNKDKQDPEVSRRPQDEDGIEGRLSP